MWQLLTNWYRKDYVGFVFVFLFFIISFGIMYFATDRFISLDDQFFHIRFTEIIKERGLDAFRDFKWLYFSKIAQDQSYFENYHFLFYLTLLPFTAITPLYLGIKWYAIIFGALAFTGLYYFLRKLGEKYPLIWTVLIFAAVNTRFVLRFINARPLTLAPVLLLFILYLLYRKKYLGALFLSLFYFLWHSATFIFPLVVAGVYLGINRLTTKRWDWKIFLYPLIGVAGAYTLMALLVPGFFQFMRDITFSVIYQAIVMGRENIIEGTELYPADYFAFVRPNILFFTLLIIAWGSELYRWWNRQKQELSVPLTDERSTLRLTLLALTILFLIATFLVRRNSDYFIFFAGAYLAMAINQILTGSQILPPQLRPWLVGAAIVVSLFFFTDNLLVARNQISQARPHELLAPVADWLKANVPPGQILFNVSRDDFPTLFYYDQDHYFVTGLETRFLYDYDPRRYWLWQHISQDGVACPEATCPETNAQNPTERGQGIAETLLKDFQTRFLITNYQFPKLNAVIDQTPNFQQFYGDQYYAVYLINPTPVK